MARDLEDDGAGDDGTARRRLAALSSVSLDGWLPAPPDLPTRRALPISLSAVGWLAAAGAVVLVVALAMHWRHSGAAPAYPAANTAPVAVPTPSAATIVVDVGGRVRHPGLVTLPVGSRVADAIAAAGGALRPADVETIDLAAKVADGELVLVGVPGAAAGSGAAAGPLNLNTATVEQLDALPGVGPVLAQRIVDYREAHGGFGSVEDLQHVPGIGARKFADLKSLVTA